MRVNNGYEITDNIFVNKLEIVVGYNANAPDPYVCWMCVNDDNYYWGKYCAKRETAMGFLQKRADKEIQYSRDMHIEPVIKTTMNIQTEKHINKGSKSQER